MTKKDVIDRFSHDIDNLLRESGASDTPDTPDGYQTDLELARLLIATDYSRESNIKHTLKRQLLERIEDKTLASAEVPGPLQFIKQLFTHSHSVRESSVLPHRSRFGQFIGLAAASVMVVVGLMVVVWFVQPQAARSFLSALVQIIMPERESSQQLSVQWTFRGSDGISVAPATDGNFVYVVGNSGDVVALDAQTGREIWRSETGLTLDVPPTVTEDRIYVGGAAKLLAFDKFSGTQHWQADVELAGAPAATNSTVYLSSRDGRLLALDTANGAPRWQFQSSSALASAPTVAGDTVFVGSQDRHLYAVDRETGQQRWRYRTGNGVASTPLVVANTVFFGSNDEFVYALDTATGDERWRFRTGNDVFASPVISGPTLFIGSYDGNLYAIDVETGKERWHFETGKPIKSTAAIEGDTVYVGSGDGTLYGLDAATGQLLSQFETDSQLYTAPVVAEEQILLVGGKGQLWALNRTLTPNNPVAEPASSDDLTPPGNGTFPFTPGGWYVTGDAQAIRFQGHIVDESGQPVDGFSVQIDNGSRTLISLPSGPNHWQPQAEPGQWEIVVDNPQANSGWWWLTAGRYACSVEAAFDAQCAQFERLSESVKVEIVAPDETVINADWICHTACQTGVTP